MMKNNVLDANYSMLLGRPWLWDAKVTHDLRNKLISIEGNGIIHTIAITKHLDNNIKCPKVLLCYNFDNGVTNEEEDVLLVIESNLFIIDIIILLELQILAVVSTDVKTGTNAQTTIDDAPPNSSRDPKVGPRVKTLEEEESWGMLFNLKDFRGRRACWSFEMGLGWTHKREFKMKSTCTTKKKKQLMQVEWKWCDAFNKYNLNKTCVWGCLQKSIQVIHSSQPLGNLLWAV